MRNAQAIKSSVFVFAIVLAMFNINSAQTTPEAVKRVNFGYSQNPKTKTKSANSENNVKAEILPATNNENSQNSIDGDQSNASSENIVSPIIKNETPETQTIAVKTLEIVKRANANAVSPTEIYKVGIGDVLFISLQNAPAKASTYFTVLNDGTIDYPLAGEMVSVSGLTTEEIEDSIKAKIKLYENPQVSVKVREHASHSVTVLGLVEKAGEKYLPREAVPLFMIRAEAIVQPKADLLVIKRANQETEQVDLKDAKSDDVLIFPGDFLEFKASEVAVNKTSASQFFYIGGQIISAGQKDFYQGMTLTQAILASGGLKKANVKKVVIRRKNQDGLLSPTMFDLSAIKNGKQPDPLIQAGDTIEINN